VSLLPPKIYSKIPFLSLTKKYLKLSLQFIYGTIDELIAGPRLLPLVVLNILWKFGFLKELRKKYLNYSTMSLADGNPALDYIGTGGGTLLRDIYPRRKSR
jgi:hypothetical protein